MMKLFLVAGITSVASITSAATSSTALLRCSDRTQRSARDAIDLQRMDV